MSGPTYCIAVTPSSPNMATGALQRPCCASLAAPNQEALHVTLSYHLAASLRCDLPNILALPSFQVSCAGTLSCDTPLAKPFSNCHSFRITERINYPMMVGTSHYSSAFIPHISTLRCHLSCMLSRALCLPVFRYYLECGFLKTVAATLESITVIFLSESVHPL